MISIATKFRPFTHRHFSKCLLPRTNIVIEASPEMLKIGSLEVPLDHDPHAKDFTLQMDLEKCCVWVFGRGFRYRIFASEKGIAVADSKETKFFPMGDIIEMPKEMERLSLGVHKSQDWELVSRRMDMKEILPILYYLAQTTPSISTSEKQIDLETFYRSSFLQMLVPKRENALKEAFFSIRSRFIVEEGRILKLLPNNPFFYGRMLNVQVPFGFLDMHWVKKKLQRVTLHVKREGEVIFDLQKPISSFRVKEQLEHRGVIHSTKDVLILKKGKLFLDRFNENTHY